MSNKQDIKIGIVIGEHSGDILGSKIIESLKKEFNVHLVGVGGPLTEKHGLKSIFDFKDLHIIIKRDTFDIIKFKNNALLSYNSIEYTSTNDIIYFLIGHLEKMKLEKPEIHITGNTVKLKEIETITNRMDSLKKYSYRYHADTNLFDLIP